MSADIPKILAIEMKEHLKCCVDPAYLCGQVEPTGNPERIDGRFIHSHFCQACLDREQEDDFCPITPEGCTANRHGAAW